MLPSIRKFFKSISLCGLFSMSLLGLFSLFPLLPISAQDIADQHPLPDSIGSNSAYLLPDLCLVHLLLGRDGRKA